MMRMTLPGFAWLVAVACLVPMLFADDPAGLTAENKIAAQVRVSVDEARGRARLLHEVISGALQVMHRDFFDPDDRDRIPSSSLEDVFDTVEAEHGVKLKWLGVNAKVMDSDHKAAGDFEERAVIALRAGAEEFDASEEGAFRFVGAIRLHNACLKCHVPFRQSLETRLAGLSISIPTRREEPDSEQR